MYYSLTFGGEKNTWADWHLIPESPPMIPPPEPVVNLVDVPGRSKGPVDLSTAVFGKIVYQRVSGTWNFLRDVDSRNTRTEMYETIRKWLHGKLTTVTLEEDPLHYYKGRFLVSQPSSNAYPIKISISYSLEPVRYNLDGTVDSSYITEWTE